MTLTVSTKRSFLQMSIPSRSPAWTALPRTSKTPQSPEKLPTQRLTALPLSTVTAPSTSTFINVQIAKAFCPTRSYKWPTQYKALPQFLCSPLTV